MGSVSSYYSIEVDAGGWNLWKYPRIINSWTFWERHGIYLKSRTPDFFGKNRALK